MQDPIINNIFEQFSFIPGKIPNVDVTIGEHLTTINSHLNSSFFNIAYIHGDNLPTPAKIKQRLNQFERENIPLSLRVLDFQEKKLAHSLKDNGFICIDEELIMTGKLNQIAYKVKKEVSLEIKLVDDQQKLSNWIQTFCKVYPDDEATIRAAYQQAYTVIEQYPKKIRWYLGYFNGDPVTTCAVFSSDNLVGLSNLVTVPQAQRKGIAAKMMEQILLIVQQKGYSDAVICSVEMVQGFYRNMGFKPYCFFKSYQQPQVN